MTKSILVASALSVLAFQAGAQTPAAAATLSLCEIENKLTAQGITIHEVELRSLVAEIEGRDVQGRKVEVLVDRRTGEILSQKPDR